MRTRYHQLGGTTSLTAHYLIETQRKRTPTRRRTITAPPLQRPLAVSLKRLARHQTHRKQLSSRYRKYVPKSNKKIRKKIGKRKKKVMIVKCLLL